MFYLILVTFIWAFSFSFIGIYLAGQVDTWFAILIRISLAFILFLPFLRIYLFSLRQIITLSLIGAVQLGIMYLFYYQAFMYISVSEVLLFTIFTPIYITLLYDILKKRPIHKYYLFTTVLAVLGAAIIRYQNISREFIIGFLLIQGANLCFAFGQVSYKRFIEDVSMSLINQRYAFAWVYFGALVVAVICWLLFGDMQRLPTTSTQWYMLVWLGCIASGICYFLWNYGATKVNSGTLAIMNNMVIPIGIIINVTFWHQAIDWERFLIGAFVIVFSLYIHQRYVS